MKKWLRREVLMPLLFLVIYGGALLFLIRKFDEAELIQRQGLMTWLLVASVVIYIILIVITFRHIFAAYLLERFDPGDTGSIRRLARSWRFRLPVHWESELFFNQFPDDLAKADFNYMSGDLASGVVYFRRQQDFWTRRPRHDRMLMLETDTINIFRVDRLLKNTIDQLDNVKPQSDRNILIIAVRMEDKQRVASAAAGCVNFMGQFKGGSLFPVLLDLNHNRIYYPVNRSLISRKHKRLQDQLLAQIRGSGLPDRKHEKVSLSSIGQQIRSNKTSDTQ